MKQVEQGLHHLGSTALASGLIWAAISGLMPGTNALAEALPEAVVNVPAALALAGFGAAMIGLSNMLARRAAPQHTTPHGATHQPGAQPGAKPAAHRTAQIDWSDPSIQARLNEIGESQLKAEKSALGPYFGKAQTRIALRPCWPQRVTQSWVGGMPKLPQGMAWPAIQGSPAVFLAQIALSDMPKTLWQGAGPRDGWLVVWGDGETGQNTVCRHVTGALIDHPPPPHSTPNWHWNMSPAGLHAALGDAGQIPPKWYLEMAAPDALGAVQDMMAGNPAYWDDDTGAYIWEQSWTSLRSRHTDAVDIHPDLRYGIDWPSLFGLIRLWRAAAQKKRTNLRRRLNDADANLAQLRAQQQKDMDKLLENPGIDPSSVDALRVKQDKALSIFHSDLDNATREEAQIGEALHQGDTLLSQLRDMARDTDFFADIGKESLSALQSFYAGAAIQYNAERRLFLENYGRHLYLTNPDALPEAMFDLYAPLWALQCKETLIFVGLDQGPQDGMQSDARLIDIPSHPLAGLSFGDESRFYVDLRMRDLVAGHWHKATSNDTHGL